MTPYAADLLIHRLQTHPLAKDNNASYFVVMGTFAGAREDVHPGHKVLGIPGVIACRLIGRLNRFVVEVDIQGERHRAYINNTGRLYQFLSPDRKGYCLKNERPGRTGYRLFAIEDDCLAAIIDTQLQMRAFEQAAALRLIPWLNEFEIERRNARLGSSLIDYRLSRDGDVLYLEVKSAVLREGNYAMYPDCPSARGRRHVAELTRHVSSGGQAIILFIAGLPGVAGFKPYEVGDEALCRLLRDAHRIGVVLKSIGMAYHSADSAIYLYNADLPVKL